MEFEIRKEEAGDVAKIRDVTTAAFEVAEHSDGTEAAIVDALRAANALTISLVATVGGEVVGHVAFSPVTIGGQDVGWFGLGPVSVRPECHGQGIGAAMITEGLGQLKAAGANGCVVLGDPNYYQRFGFASTPDIRYEGVPPEYFLSLHLDGAPPSGNVAYHEGFSAS